MFGFLVSLVVYMDLKLCDIYVSLKIYAGMQPFSKWMAYAYAALVI